MPAQQQDSNYKVLSNSLYDPITAQFTEGQSAKGITAPDGTIYAPAVVTFNPQVNGVPSVAPAIVQKVAGATTGSVTTLATAFVNNNVAGNSIVVVVAHPTATAATIADSKLNTYTLVATGARSTTFNVAIYVATSILGGANTVTATTSSGSAAMELYEVSGLVAWEPAVVDQFATASGSSGTASTSVLTPGMPNELVISGVAVGTAAQTITVGTAFTNDSGQQNPTTPAVVYSFASMSQALGATAFSSSPSATFTSEPWAMVAVSLKPAAQGPNNPTTTVSAPYGGYSYKNITSATTTLVKTGPGTLHSITVNTPVLSGVIEFDDALTNTTPKIGTITYPSTLLNDGANTTLYDIAFATGLSITTTGTMDITIAYK